MIKQVPELYEGAYWYVVPATEEMNVLGAWCAQYGNVGGVEYAVLRAIEPLYIDSVNVSIANVLNSAYLEGRISSDSKFYGRIRGM